MGKTNGQFFLSQGGAEGFTKFGDPFIRKPSERSPASMLLPKLPRVIQ